MHPSADEFEPEPKQPIFNLHWVVPVIIGIMTAVHFLRVYVLADAANYQAIVSFAFIPQRYSNFEIWQLSPFAAYWSPLTYSLLHADWTHVIMNSFWLLAFGGVTARRLGALRFVILFSVGALGGAALHYVFHGNDISPMIGASASVSACMGAAIRLPAFSENNFKGDLKNVRIRSLVEALTNRQAITFIGVWFGINLLFGAGVVDITGNGNSIAWEAHIGGFVAGFFLFGIIDDIFKKTTSRTS